MKGKFFLAVFVCLFSFPVVGAQGVLKIDEAETRIIFQEKSARLFFVAENLEGGFNSEMMFDLLDVKGIVRSTVKRNGQVASGRKTYEISLPLLDLMRENSDEIGWFRLRYRIADDNRKIQSEGVISLSEILKDAFELRVISSENIIF